MADFKVLVADKLSAEGVAVLEAHPAVDVTVATGLAPEALHEKIKGFHGLIIRSSTTVTPELLAVARDLKVVARAGIGVDNVDIEASTKAGVVVENTPLGNATSAAEHAIALLFSLARQVPQAHATMRAGEWAKSNFKGVELDGKTFGLIGGGNIGSIAGSKAKGIGMNVVVFDPFLKKERADELGFEQVDLDTLLSRAAAISVHVPLVDGTRGLLNDASLAKVKKGALLVHAARGGVVEEAAVIRALEDGRLRGAAFDVFEEEPLAADHPLRGRDDVVLTPHLGASTVDAQIRVGVQAAEQVIALLTEGQRINNLNNP